MPVESKLPFPAAAPPAAQLLDVRDVAAMLHCSERHVFRLADSGAMPAPRKLGALVRWDRDELKSWIAAGCPAVSSKAERGQQ